MENIETNHPDITPQEKAVAVEKWLVRYDHRAPYERFRLATPAEIDLFEYTGGVPVVVNGKGYLIEDIVW